MDMSDETTTSTSINSHSTWSSNRYYEIILIAFSLGLSNSEQFMEDSFEPGFHIFFGYVVVLLIIGVPLLIVELSLGQYSRKGIIKFWEICPLFYGFGYLSFGLTASNLLLNLMASSQILKYTLNQFFWESGWDKCTNAWNSEYCYTLNTSFTRVLDCYDIHGQEDCDNGRWESSYFQYFIRRMMVANSIISWRNMLLTQLIVLLLIGVAYKGCRFMEKCILICICLAAINFSILLYVSLIQRGAGEGLKLFMSFNFLRLKEPAFWAKRFEQIVWATGIGQGVIKLLGSENKFRGHSYMNGLMMILLIITVTFVELIFYLTLCGNSSYTLYRPVEIAFKDTEIYMYAKIPKMLESLQGSHKLWCFLYYSHLFLIRAVPKNVTHCGTNEHFFVFGRNVYFKELVTSIVRRHIIGYDDSEVTRSCALSVNEKVIRTLDYPPNTSVVKGTVPPIMVRSTGPIDIVTHQPLKGRKRGGGVRFGEIERDSLLSHGASFLLQDRLLHCSDATTALICTSCGTLLGPKTVVTRIADKKHQIETEDVCRLCGPGKNIAEIQIPYIFKFFVTQLASCNINVKIKTQTV